MRLQINRSPSSTIVCRYYWCAMELTLTLTHLQSFSTSAIASKQPGTKAPHVGHSIPLFACLDRA